MSEELAIETHQSTKFTAYEQFASNVMIDTYLVLLREEGTALCYRISY